MISKYEKTNGVKLLAIVAIFAMVLCAFAIIPSESEAASSDTQSYSGILDGDDVAQSFPVGTNVVIDDTLTISNGAKMYVYGGSLTVNTGVTINVQSGGELIIGKGSNVNDDAVATLVTINGTVTINGENSKVTIYNTDSSVDYKTSGVIINGTVSVVRGGSLIADETKGGSVLINNGGSLAVSSSGSRISYITGINVDLAVGGTFNLDGRVASEAAKTMTVTSYGSGDDKTTAKATITSGTVTAGDNNTSNLTFTTTSGSYTAYAADESTKVVREYVLNVEGTVNGKDSITLSSIESASVESLFTSKDAAKVTNDDYTYNDKVVGKVSIGSLDIKDGSDFIVDQGAYVIVAGKLTVNALEYTGNGTWRLDYTYTLTGATGHKGPDEGESSDRNYLSDKREFTVEVTDRDGNVSDEDKATGTITVDIRDDVPYAQQIAAMQQVVSKPISQEEQPQLTQVQETPVQEAEAALEIPAPAEAETTAPEAAPVETEEVEVEVEQVEVEIPEDEDDKKEGV